MVVPLKLTQFYGHSVPRPRIYADVKFSDQRVDPPPSVNEALLSWAADANWSMGGLSLKRLRAQGKLEGSARRLRAQLEEEEEEEEEVEAECHGGDDKTKIGAKKKAGASGGLGEKRKRDEEAVEATPVKKLKKKEKDGETEAPGSVSVSQEKKKSSKVRSISAEVISEVISASKQKKKGVQPVKALSFVPATAERRQSKASDLSGKIFGPLTRSAKKQAFDQSAPASAQQQPKRGRHSVRKALLSDKPANHGGDSSDSDDGLEGLLEQKNRPLRRSSRLIHDSLKSLKHDSSESDSDSA